MSDLVVTLTVEQLRKLVQEAATEALSGVQSSSAPEVMTLAECASVLRRHPRIVMNLVREDGLPAHYISEREPRFLRSEVLAWLSSRAVPEKE